MESNVFRAPSEMIGQGLGASGGGLLPRFYPRQIQKRDPKNLAAFIDHTVDWVEITILNDDKAVVSHIVTQADIDTFPDHWRAYQAGASQIIGTPIARLGLEEAFVKHLSHHNVLTIEALASMTDAAIQRVGAGFMSIRERAKAFLDQTSRNERNEALERQNTDLTDRIKLLETQLDKMMGMIARLTPAAQAVAELAADPSAPPVAVAVRKAK